VQGNFAKLCLLALGLAAVPVTGWLLMKTTVVLAGDRPERNTQRLMAQVAAAQAILANDRAEGEFPSFIHRLKKIDATRVPRAVEKAYSNYVASAEDHFSAMRKAANTNTTYSQYISAESRLNEEAARVKKRR
jgi:hypothetical protein